MRNPEIEKKMYELAVKLIEKRYPTGWGGAGVIHTNKGPSHNHAPTEL